MVATLENGVSIELPNEALTIVGEAVWSQAYGGYWMEMAFQEKNLVDPKRMPIVLWLYSLKGTASLSEPGVQETVKALKKIGIHPKGSRIKRGGLVGLARIRHVYGGRNQAMTLGRNMDIPKGAHQYLALDSVMRLDEMIRFDLPKGTIRHATVPNEVLLKAKIAIDKGKYTRVTPGNFSGPTDLCGVGGCKGRIADDTLCIVCGEKRRGQPQKRFRSQASLIENRIPKKSIRLIKNTKPQHQQPHPTTVCRTNKKQKSKENDDMDTGTEGLGKTAPTPPPPFAPSSSWQQRPPFSCPNKPAKSPAYDQAALATAPTQAINDPTRTTDRT